MKFKLSSNSEEGPVQGYRNITQGMNVSNMKSEFVFRYVPIVKHSHLQK